ncbi:hypothetical protein EYF80_010349 [Liparis tanakae]|uniref:Uncharacterized protein n=1 Tax=Liparis tanakae TaxID=230148 RepID=A0A4Z2IN83_9TELE|nr:hypothetical protein EYF80_010349 [Liparis tanakae]
MLQCKGQRFDPNSRCTWTLTTCKKPCNILFQFAVLQHQTGKRKDTTGVRIVPIMRSPTRFHCLLWYEGSVGPRGHAAHMFQFAVLQHQTDKQKDTTAGQTVVGVGAAQPLAGWRAVEVSRLEECSWEQQSLLSQPSATVWVATQPHLDGKAIRKSMDQHPCPRVLPPLNSTPVAETTVFNGAADRTPPCLRIEATVIQLTITYFPRIRGLMCWRAENIA